MSIDELNEFMYNHGFCNTDNSEDLPKKYVADLVESALREGYNRAVDEFVKSLISSLTDAIYKKDVKSMTNLINTVANNNKDNYNSFESTNINEASYNKAIDDFGEELIGRLSADSSTATLLDGRTITADVMTLNLMSEMIVELAGQLKVSADAEKERKL